MIENWWKKIKKLSKKEGKRPRTSPGQTANSSRSTAGLERGDRRKTRRNLRQKKDDQKLWWKIRASRGGKKKSEKQQKILNSNVTGYRRKNLRWAQKSSCSKDGEERKHKRRRERRADPKRVLSLRWRTIYSPARPGSPAGPGPPGPLSSERWVGNGRETAFSFLLFFWFFSFLFQCFGNSLVLEFNK